jgi:hypothetical protein
MFFSLNLENSLLHEASTFIPTLSQSVEKAVNQFTQPQILYEAVNSAVFLITLITADPSLESKLTNVLTLIYDAKKQLFTHEKFYTTTTNDGLKDYCLLFNKLNQLAPSKDTFDLR